MDNIQNRKVPKSIRQTPSCSSCAFAYWMGNYDDAPSGFCTFEAPPRPLDFWDIGIGEHKIEDKTEREAAYERWHEWTNGREVRDDELCDHYQNIKVTS